MYLLNIFANAAPKSKQKISKIIVQFLAIVNHWNWLDDSPPLNVSQTGSGGGSPATGGRGGLGVKPPAPGRFFQEAILNAIGFHFARVQSYLKELNF